MKMLRDQAPALASNYSEKALSRTRTSWFLPLTFDVLPGTTKQKKVSLKFGDFDGLYGKEELQKARLVA